MGYLEESGPKYTYTNEDLDAITAGLDIQREDRVLAVARSGDQALAILGKAGFVKAVDSSMSQVDFFKKRIVALREQDYLTALGVEVSPNEFSPIPLPNFSDTNNFTLNARNQYFLKEGYLDEIRQKLSLLVVEQSDDVLDFAQKASGFSKIYLSNVFNYRSVSSSTVSSELSKLEGIANNLPIGGLIYVSNHKEIRNNFIRFKDPRITVLPSINPAQFLSSSSKLAPWEKIEEAYFLPSNLKLNLELSRAARKLNGELWSPAVYQKI